MENGKVVCLFCGKKSNNLVFHHKHGTGQTIAILCVDSIKKFGNKTEFKNGIIKNISLNVSVGLNFIYPKYTYIPVSRNTAKRIQKVKIAELESYDKRIIRIIDEYKDTKLELEELKE